MGVFPWQEGPNILNKKSGQQNRASCFYKDIAMSVYIFTRGQTPMFLGNKIRTSRPHPGLAPQHNIPQGGGVYRPTKVRNLQLPLEPQEQVLRLYVSVNYLLLVAVHQRVRQLLHDLGRPVTGGQTGTDLQLPAAPALPPASGPLWASQVPTPSQPWLFAAGQKCGSSAAPCRAPRGGHTPESGRSFAGHRNSCRDARCWDAWEERHRGLRPHPGIRKWG